MDRAFRIESCRDARAICRLRRHVDTAGLSGCVRAVRGIRADSRRRQDYCGAQRSALRGESRHDQVLARGADVSTDARGDSRASGDVSPRAAHRRPRELCGSRRADGARDRLELRRPADAGDRRPLARLYIRARWMAPRQCGRKTGVGDRDCTRRGRIDSRAETFFVDARGLDRKPRRMAQTSRLVRAFRALQQGHRQLRISRSSPLSRFGERSADGAVVHATRSPSHCCGCGRLR